jgi:hypothetical protein
MKCANCGEENASGEKFCDGCGFPLEEAEQIDAPPEVTPLADGIQCPRPECGKVNPAGTAFCVECGAELSGQVPTGHIPASPLLASGRLILPDKSEISLPEGAKTIGRGDLDRAIGGEELTYISREHILVTFENGEYYVEDRNSANSTNLNGIEIKGKGKHLLKDGDLIEVANVAKLTFKRS